MILWLGFTVGYGPSCCHLLRQTLSSNPAGHLSRSATSQQKFTQKVGDFTNRPSLDPNRTQHTAPRRSKRAQTASVLPAFRVQAQVSLKCAVNCKQPRASPKAPNFQLDFDSKTPKPTTPTRSCRKGQSGHRLQDNCRCWNRVPPCTELPSTLNT